MSDDECRQAFEKWFREKYAPLDGLVPSPGEWNAWAAAWTHLTTPVMCIHGVSVGTSCDLCERETTASRATVLEEAASLFHEEDGYLLTGAQIGRAIRALKRKS